VSDCELGGAMQFDWRRSTQQGMFCGAVMHVITDLAMEWALKAAFDMC